MGSQIVVRNRGNGVHIAVPASCREAGYFLCLAVLIASVWTYAWSASVDLSFYVAPKPIPRPTARVHVDERLKVITVVADDRDFGF
jgi:hypothetical protein